MDIESKSELNLYPSRNPNEDEMDNSSLSRKSFRIQEKMSRDPIRRKTLHPNTNEVYEDVVSERYSDDSNSSSSEDVSVLPKDLDDHSIDSSLEISPKKIFKSKKENNIKKSLFFQSIFQHYYVMFIFPISFLFALSLRHYIWGENLTSLDVKTIIMNLKKEFKEQPPMTFAVIKAAVEKVIDTPEPKAPAIVILLAAKGAERMAQHFAGKLVESVSRSSKYIVIQGEEFKDEEPVKAKKIIDEILRKNLDATVLKAVLVKDLDEIPVEAAMIFHSYCDHENAPFKTVIYVMIVSSGVPIHKDTGPKIWDVLTINRLNEAWSSLHEEDVSSLLSRLTVSVAAILPPSL